MAKVICLSGNNIDWEITIDGKYMKTAATENYIYLLGYKGDLYRAVVNYDDETGYPVSLQTLSLWMKDVYDINRWFAATSEGVYDIGTKKLLMKCSDVLLGDRCLLDDQRYLWLFNSDELVWQDRKFESIMSRVCIDADGVSWIFDYDSDLKIRLLDDYNACRRLPIILTGDKLLVHNSLMIPRIKGFEDYYGYVLDGFEVTNHTGVMCLTLDNKLILATSTSVGRTLFVRPVNYTIKELYAAIDFSSCGSIISIIS